MSNIPFTPKAPSVAGRAAAVTPSDTTVVNATQLWVGGAGNVAVIPMGQTDVVTFTSVAAGTLLPISCTKVMAATTATEIVALL